MHTYVTSYWMKQEGETASRVDVPERISRIEFDVEWPPGHVASYLILEPEVTLIDAGDPGTTNTQILTRELETIGLQISDISNVIITHPHIDHVGLVPEIRSNGNPTIYAPKPYQQTLTQSDEELQTSISQMATHAGVPNEEQQEFISHGFAHQQEIIDRLPADAIDEWIVPDSEITIGGWTFESIFTPGHQQHHICLLTNTDDGDLLFSGDMLIKPFRAAAVHANLSDDQTEAIQCYYDSLDTLSTIHVDMTFPGHGPIHTTYEDVLQTSYDSLDRLLERTKAAVNESGSHAVEVVSNRSDKPAEGPWLPETIGALAYLESQGELASELREGVRYYFPTSESNPN